jgi:MFS superfamily sulfate permease-like transporter
MLSDAEDSATPSSRIAPQIWPDFRFNLQEIAGAVGDFGTLIPIVLGMALVSDIRLGPVLLCFSAWYIITGIYYRMPVPVEPMKAIGAIVIAERLSSGTIAASGIVLGLFFLVFGSVRGMKSLQERVPHSVIKGVQMGLALMLARTATGFIQQDHVIAAICMAIVLCFLIIGRSRKIPDISAIVVLLIGVAVGLARYGLPQITLTRPPLLTIPTAGEFLKGSWTLALPQAPLTITNAVLATTLLMKSLVNRDVKPDSLSKSIGLMTLTSSIVGGIPMCHGAGGLVAQYRFGARTGGSNIISGLILLPIALFFASPGFIATIPVGAFGALLVFVAIEIGRHSWRTDSPLTTATVAILALVFNMTIGFVVGIAVAYALRKMGNRSERNEVRNVK